MRIVSACFYWALLSFVIISIFTHSNFDSSWAKSSNSDIANFFGIYGSVFSDLLFEFFGSSTYLFGILITIIALKKIFYSNKIVSRFHFALAIIAFLAFSILSTKLARYSLIEKYIEIGFLGEYIYNIATNDLPEFIIDFILLASTTICTLLVLDLKIIQFIKNFKKKDKEYSFDTQNFEAEFEEIMEQTPIVRKKPAKKTIEKRVTKIPSDFILPGADILNQVCDKNRFKKLSKSELEEKADELMRVLSEFGIKGEIRGIHPGPVVTLFELVPAAGTKSARVIGLSDDIARSMSALSTRISVIPGRNALGIELPNTHRETVFIRELIESAEFSSNRNKIPIILGKDIGGNSQIVDLSKMPHLLVAGTTGSGKSVGINSMIVSILYSLTPKECKFIMIDPKMLELSVYDGIPHLLTPVVTDPKKAIVALKWTVKEMENRYKLMSNLGVRNISNYNEKIIEAKEKGEILKRQIRTGFDPETGKPLNEEVEIKMEALPFIVVVVDEMADLMLVAGKDIESSIQRLAQMARAAGIHIIMATQRPSVDVITGVIKANFPTRMSFQVTSKIDSRTILGETGAEQLLGLGDMLYMSGGNRVIRVHGTYVADDEVSKIVDHLKTQGTPDYLEEVTESDDEMDFLDPSESSDSLYDQAVAIVLRDKRASTSYIQRKLKIGYNKAASLIEKMEEEGVVSAANHVGKREILVS